MVYEAMLVFAIFFIAGGLFDVLTQSRHALYLRHARQLWLFLVIGAYFVYCWNRSGQTLAMQTWRIRLADLDGGKVPVVKAIVRYCLAWMWFIPAMAISFQFGLQQWPMVLVIATGLAGWALTARFDKDGQFLHDRLARTRLIHIEPDAVKKGDVKA